MKKKVGRENVFTSDFRIFHVTVSRFSLPAFFLSRSILGRFTFNFFFTFDFRGFHVTFSARSEPKRGSEDRISGCIPHTRYKSRNARSKLGPTVKMSWLLSLIASREGMSRPNISLNRGPNMRNPIVYEP